MLEWTQPSFKFSLYDWQNRESFLQHLQTLVSGHYPSHSAPSSYRLFAPLFGDFLSLQSLVQALGAARLLGLHGFPPYPHPSEGLDNNNNNSILCWNTKANDGDVKYRARYCHIFLYYKLSLKQLTISKIIFFFTFS